MEYKATNRYRFIEEDSIQYCTVENKKDKDTVTTKNIVDVKKKFYIQRKVDTVSIFGKVKDSYWSTQFCTDTKKEAEIAWDFLKENNSFNKTKVLDEIKIEE